MNALCINQEPDQDQVKIMLMMEAEVMLMWQRSEKSTERVILMKSVPSSWPIDHDSVREGEVDAIMIMIMVVKQRVKLSPWRQMARFLKAGRSQTRGSTAWSSLQSWSCESERKKISCSLTSMREKRLTFWNRVIMATMEEKRSKSESEEIFW